MLPLRVIQIDLMMGRRQLAFQLGWNQLKVDNYRIIPDVKVR